jgi:hypothetical protein
MPLRKELRALFRRGWSALQVQRFLGHSDPAYTCGVSTDG